MIRYPKIGGTYKHKKQIVLHRWSPSPSEAAVAISLTTPTDNVKDVLRGTSYENLRGAMITELTGNLVGNYILNFNFNLFTFSPFFANGFNVRYSL